MSKVSKQEILAAAAQCFAQSGFEGATLRQIAQKCSVQPPSLFHHFPGGKQEIYEAISLEMNMVLGQLIGQLGLTAHGKERVQKLITGLWQFFAEHPEYAAMSLREMLAPNAERLESQLGNSRQLIEAANQLIAREQEQGNLPQGDARNVLFWLTVNVMGYFSLAGLHTVVFSDDGKDRSRNQDYLNFLVAMMTRASADSEVTVQGI